MTDLGTLGGTYGYPNWLNNHGQVVGFSNMPGDWFGHPFFWDKGVMTDMGTLGGYYANSYVINDAGQAVGISDLADFTHHAFVWSKGKMTDLGAVGMIPVATASTSTPADRWLELQPTARERYCMRSCGSTAPWSI